MTTFEKRCIFFKTAGKVALVGSISNSSRQIKLCSFKSLNQTATILLKSQVLFNRSPSIRPVSSRHSVCRMVVTQISETKFPVSRSPINNNNSFGSPKSSDHETSNSVSSPRLRSSRISEHYSQSNKKLEICRSGGRSVESPVHVEHSILHDHVLPR